jgi:capsule biosynthesis phosphatase
MRKKVKTIVFDLDDTICFPNHKMTDTFDKYGCARPNRAIIKSMRILKDNGFRIVISSARRMLTHDGDIAKIVEDVDNITRMWLYTHRVPYDEIQWGKPYASSYYVDDKAMTPEMLVEQVTSKKEWTLNDEEV